MRRTKKGRNINAPTAIIGGAELVFVCRHGRTATDKCIKDFEDQQEFTFVDAKPDGNCFFHTLAMYYGFKHTNQATLRQNTHTELRQHVVQYMLSHYEDYAPLGISREEIEEMGEDGAWNSDAGDLMPPAAAAALHLHIQLYDIVPGTRVPPTKKRILLHHYPEEGKIPEDTVHVLRIHQGHYGLLLPLREKKIAEPNRVASTSSLSSVYASSPSTNKTKNHSVKKASVKKAKMSTKEHLAALNAKEKEYRALLTMNHSKADRAMLKKLKDIPERLEKIAAKKEELQQRNAVELEKAIIQKRSKTSKK